MVRYELPTIKTEKAWDPGSIPGRCITFLALSSTL